MRLSGPSYYIVNWTAHGLVVAVVVFALSLPWGHTGAIVGYVGGVLAYFIGETIGAIKGGTSPWWDHVGDVMGPFILGFVAVRLFG